MGEQLPAYMVPGAFLAIERLPLTPNGKVDFSALPAPRFEQAAGGDMVEPRTPTERKLVEVWRSVLDIERVGVTDNFFALGGHSLLAMRVMARVREEFAVALALRAIFDSPTVAQLATSVDTAQRADEPALVPLRRTNLRTTMPGVSR